MANMPGGSYGSRGRSENDIYTALVIIASSVVLLSIVFVVVKSIELLGALPSFKL